MVRQRMTQTSNFLLYTVVLIVIFPSQLSMYGTSLTILTGLGLVIFITINLIYLLSKKYKLQIPKILLPIFFGLTISSIISYIMIGILKPIIVYGALISLFIVVRTLTNNVRNLDKLIVEIVFGACLTGLFIVFLGCFDNEIFSFATYSGFFKNPNSMGMFSAGLAHMTLGVLYAFKDELTKFKKYFFFLILFLSLLLVVASTSRAGIFSVAVTISILIVFEISKTFKFLQLKIKTKKLFVLTFILITLFLIVSTFYSLGIFDFIIVKFYRPDWQGGLSSGRFEGWIYALNNWRWFGHENFKDFAHITGGIKFLGHSTWIMHLNNYGLLAVSFFIGWLVLIFFWSWQKATNGKFKSSIVLLTILVGYCVNATFEEATSTPGIIISIIMFAILFKRNNKILIKQQL